MGSRQLLLILLFACAELWGMEEIKDTLYSRQGDRVILSYSIANDNGNVTIRFSVPEKELGLANQKKFKKIYNVDAVFFDKKGNYKDGTIFSGIDIEAFMTGMSYEVSHDGYFLLHTSPTISFKISSSEEDSLSIPMFLAYCERRQRYKVFCRLNDLKVKIPKKKRVVDSPQKITLQIADTIVTTEVGSNTDDVTTLNLINAINGLLEKQKDSTFSDALNDSIAKLKRKIDDESIDERSEIFSKIEGCLRECETKKKNLIKEIKEREKEIHDSINKAKKDSIAEVRQKEIEDRQIKESRKQTIWLIVSGFVLAILSFAGNQIMQRIRDIKNKKDIQEMQKKAADEAKRQMASAAQSQANQLQGKFKRPPHGANNAGNGNNNQTRNNKKRIEI